MSDLRIAVLGVGMMGADHVARITSRISGARVAVVNDYLPEKAAEVAAAVPGARVANDPFDAIAADDVDAVLLATPGPTHEKQLLACLEHRKPVLCEKPLTTDVETSLEVVRREAELGKPLIQVGFMRRFDPEYQQLKALIDGGELGQPLVMHCVHRNPAVPPSFDSAMIVKDSLVHEVDVTRFLFGEEIASVQIIRPAAESRGAGRASGPADRDLPDGQRSPRRRRAVRHHRRRLRGAHRGRRRTRQRHNWSRRRAGPQVRPRSVGRTDHAGLPGTLRDGLRHRAAAVGRRGAIGRQRRRADGMGRLRRRGGLRRRRAIAGVRRARRGRASRAGGCLT